MKAKKLVRQILTFSRVADSEKRPLSLNLVAQESRAMLERTLPKMVDLRLEIQEDLWTVNADPQQVEQVFINLATNAADAIENNGTVTISVQNLEPDKNYCQFCGMELAGRQVVIKVEDDGKGMSPEVLTKIFEPFYTTKGVGKGTGLGLSTVYGIVTGHGGHICCQSKEGDGSIFHIYLQANSQGQLELKTEDKDATESLGGSGRILVVDDEPTVRDIARKMLSRNGYEVIQAASGEEALAIYEERKDKIDLVLLDLGMPGMGGKACLKEIRRKDPEARVLIASGYIQYELTDELESLGAAGMVSKPYRKADILKAVKGALGS
jgi:two-component system cell cycle sensor histidine kinase/response regulator CckA